MRKSVRKCCVPGCLSPQDKSYHYWPKNPDISLKWCKSIFPNNPPTTEKVEKLRVCGNHFSKSDFVTNLRAELSNCKVRPILEKDAIPSILTPGSLVTPAIEKLDRKRQVNQALLDFEKQAKSKKYLLEPNNNKPETSSIGTQTDLTMGHISDLEELNHEISTNTKKKITSDQVCRGSIIKSMSNRVFEYLRQNDLMKTKLPSRRTQGRWLSEFHVSPGVNDSFLNIVQKSLEGSKKQERQTILSFDEIDLKKCYQYDSRQKQVFGPCKKMQVCMARGLFADWKQIIFFDFQTNMTKELLDKIIICCEQHGLFIRGVCFDLGNKTYLKDTELSKQDKIDEKYFFENPYDTSRKVYQFPDNPHNFKNLRNHTLDHGLLIPHGDDFIALQKSDFEQLIISDMRKELRLCPKLSWLHVNVQGAMRQKVFLATQLFSHSVSKALLYLDEDDADVKSETVLKFDKYYDSMNSSKKIGDTPYRCAFGIHEEIQTNALVDMKERMFNINFCEE